MFRQPHTSLLLLANLVSLTLINIISNQVARLLCSYTAGLFSSYLSAEAPSELIQIPRRSSLHTVQDKK